MANLASARDTSNRLMGRALLVSLLVHALAIAWIPELSWRATSGATVETVTFMRVAHIEIEPRRIVQSPPRAAAPRHRSVVVVAQASRHEVAHATRHALASPVVTKPMAAAPSVAASPRAGIEAGNRDAAPSATDTPVARAVSSQVGHSAGGYMPFGAELPTPVLDPNVRKALASLGVHVTLVVTVSDEGKTKDVEFTPAVDDQTKARIESLLTDASWDPAVCGGGISCQAQATIKL